MTQLHSAPVPTGSEHRVKPTALAVHVASAVSWGRPWRRRALSLPTPRALTFQGIRLPLQPLRSWLHMLSRAGLPGLRQPAASVLVQPDEHEDVPARIENLGFELATEMILDFANFARQSRLNATEQLPPETETSGVDVPSAKDSSAGIDELHVLGMAGSVSSESVDQDFLKVGTHEAQESPEVASAPREQVAESTAMGEPAVAVDEPRPTSMADAADVAVLTDPPGSEVVQAAQQPQERGKLSEVSLVETVTATEPPAESVVEPTAQEVAPNEMPDNETPELEVPGAITEMEHEPEPSAGVAAESAPQDMAVPEILVQLPATERLAEQLQSRMTGPAQEEPQAVAPEVVAESEVGSDPDPAPELEPQPATENVNVLEVPKPAAPAIVVRGVRIGRKTVARMQAPAKPARAAEIVGGPHGEGVSVPVVEAVAEQPLAELLTVSGEPQVLVPETITANEPIPEEATGQAQPEIAEVSAQPETESAGDVMYWQPAEPDHEPEPAQLDVPVIAPPEDAVVADELGFEPMIASLEDALAVLAAANAVYEEASVVQVEPVAPASPAQSDFASLATEVQQVDDNMPEVSTLQGIFIQKETEMTEMRDESIEADAQAGTAPITSVELQEVAATLSVPQLEADPDDVLSDVQSTLNSLAGMAQGLTQQKQAAGRLQEELEEWNNQLQERERLAGDKEERLRQLENHLKEAKTNLDRMAAENNRLLAERSEALKELAQTVDLRDKTTIKRAESIQLEQQRIDEQTSNLRARASELDERESALKRKSEELGVRLKQLQSAKDKFSTIVKSFNETVQFNSTLSAISKTVNE